IRLLLLRHLQLILLFQALPRILFSDEVFSGPPYRRKRLQKIVLGFLARVVQLAEEGKKCGEIRKDLDSQSIGLMFFGLFQPVAILWHLKGGDFDLINHAEEVWQIFYDGVRVK
ncbi:TetR/AcrR family transcriptional regulator C-terminal domain-containing protein, partial [Candidatus Riflebacteria bacterium]